MSNFYIYHHTDDDGWSSAAIVILHLLDTGKITSWNDKRINLISYSYEPNKFFLPIRDYEKDDEIYVVDLSVSEATSTKFNNFLVLLNTVNAKFTWIDHHLSSENVLNNNLDDIKTLLIKYKFDYYINKANCASFNCWTFYFRDRPMPEIIRIIDDWDCFKHKLSITKPFHYGFVSSKKNLPFIEDWQDILLDRGKCLTFVNQCVENGKAVMNFLDDENMINYSFYHFDCKFYGFNCCCLNARRNSDIFIDYDKYDLVLSFIYDGKYYKYSLYSAGKQKEVFCNIISSIYGGGGHKGAAGFTTQKLVVDKYYTKLYKIKDFIRSFKYRKLLRKGK